MLQFRAIEDLVGLQALGHELAVARLHGDGHGIVVQRAMDSRFDFFKLGLRGQRDAPS